MLIGDSFPEYIFTRTTIFALRLVAPLSITYCLLVPIFRPRAFFRRPLPFPFSVWAIAESSFYLAIYLPLHFWLQREAVHPEPPRKEERQVLFQRCLENTADLEPYLSKWFLGAPTAEIKREDVAQFFAWSLMNKKYEDVTEEENEELESYVDHFDEYLTGREAWDGRGKVQSLRQTLDPVPMQHRPLIWYLIIGTVDCISSTRLLLNNFRFYRPSLDSLFAMIPIRPLAFFGRRGATRVSYWYREHTSKKRLPVLFIHGIGVGLYTYVNFLLELNSKYDKQDQEGDIGIIAVEILPISARICAPALPGSEMRHAIREILDAHGWDEFILVGHSYGSTIAANILRDAEFSKRAKAVVLMDPICFLLHLPDVAYNFTRRKPTTASQHMLHYFSSQDMMISHTLARRFFWSEGLLWKEDVTLPLTVTLSGQDIIVPTKVVWKYLTDSETSERVESDTAEWDDGTRKVLWFNGFNHAALFTSKGARRGVATAIQQYCDRQYDAVL